MKIGGFQKVSLVDYPGKISTIIFTIGCNFRCPYCYVPQLVIPEKIKETKEIPEEHVFSYLSKNKNLLDAVVVTGGEPSLHADLPDFIQRIKSMGFLVGLETNGTNTSMLRSLIDNKLVNYIEIDIKTRLVFEKYNEIVGGVLTARMFENVKKSMSLLLTSEIDYEFRTTLLKEFHTKEDILEICKSIRGTKRYYLQNFRNKGQLVGGKKLIGFTGKEIEEIVSKGRKYVNIIYRK